MWKGGGSAGFLQVFYLTSAGMPVEWHPMQPEQTASDGVSRDVERNVLMRTRPVFFLFLMFRSAALGASPSPVLANSKTGLVIREIHYSGQLSDAKARFSVDLNVEMTGAGPLEIPLFEGDVAVLTTQLPAHLRLVRSGKSISVVCGARGPVPVCNRPGGQDRAPDLERGPFTGPAAAIGSVDVQVNGTGSEVRLLSGTTLDSVSENGGTRARGFLGPDRIVSVRWSGPRGPAEWSEKRC